MDKSLILNEIKSHYGFKKDADFTIKTLNLVFMKAKVILWKHTTLKDGTHPIKIKITQTINGVTKERYTPIGAYALPNQWDEVNRRARPNHPNSQAINIVECLTGDQYLAKTLSK